MQDVTGITTDAGGTEARVEYELKLGNLTPIAVEEAKFRGVPVCDVVVPVRKEAVGMRRYDNGWINGREFTDAV